MRVVVTNARLMYINGCRLDANYHASPGVEAMRHLAHWVDEAPASTKDAAKHTRERLQRYQTRRLERLFEVADVFIGPRFARVYVADPAQGIPFLSSSDMLQADFADVKLLSRARTPAALLDAIMLRKGWTLISRSGTVGNAAYVRGDMHGVAGSEHIMRVAPKHERIPSGFLYAFLSSPIGYSLITQGNFGAVVRHIDPDHMASLTIPRLSETTEQRIHDLIDEAMGLRTMANRQLQETMRQFGRAVGAIPSETADGRLGFAVNRRHIQRLTAQSNRPTVILARQAVTSCGNHALLRDLTSRIFHPFRMNMIYVGPGHGVPFLDLGDMMAACYNANHFMSPRTQGYDDYLLRYGWTLFSRDGTIGKVRFVGHILEGTATNQHISRIVPDPAKIPPGYLYAVMASPYIQLQVDALVYGSVIQGVYERELRHPHSVA